MNPNMGLPEVEVELENAFVWGLASFQGTLGAGPGLHTFEHLDPRVVFMLWLDVLRHSRSMLPS